LAAGCGGKGGREGRNVKKCEFIVNLGAEENPEMHQFYVADSVGMLKTLYIPSEAVTEATVIDLDETILCMRANPSLPN
jgi:hypothetical protein